MPLQFPPFARSLRFQLVVAVNVPLAILATFFLFYEYRREFAQRVREKRVALEEEAKTILPAVAALRPEGLDDVQEYVDTVCSRMRERDSPGHHIAVVFPDGAVQARAHHRASPEMIAAMQRAAAAATRKVPMGNDEMIVGHYRQSDVDVFVSEMLNNIRRSARGDLMQRAVAFLILAGVGGVVVNLVLVRLVTRPISQLVRVVRRIAAGDLATRAAEFSTTELSFLAGEINQMGQALADADQYRRLQMAKARDIQRHLLVDDRAIDGLPLASRFLPADEVGGDYYDVVMLPDGRILLCVADVTGHGVAAAMATMLLRSLLHTAVEQREGPREILEFINHHFWESTLPGDFASACLVAVDPARQRLAYASAGHESAWIVSTDGTCRELDSTGLILGIDESADWDQRELSLQPGDRLLMVTDGVTETFGSDAPGSDDESVFGQERLVRLMVASRNESLQESVDRLSQALVAFRRGTPQLDDVTIVLAELP